MLFTGFNILLMILGFGLLIFIHELGHFVAAKWAGIRTEAFAVGMGPVVLSWRKGVGFAAGSTHYKVVRKTGKAASDLTDAELEQHDIGETEYSLRWLPIGGFVRMLGQEDANPEAISEDPRSYNKCPIGKRMIVVSAGVIMNVILAAVLFVAVFMIGVRFDAPIVGGVAPASPGATAVADNAERLGITTIGLQPGDVVTHVDGKEAKTFADVQIAGAMSRPNVPVNFTVQRDGVDEPLNFAIEPVRDPVQGLRSIGVMPAFSLELPRPDRTGAISNALRQAGLWEQGVRPGMAMIEANGRSVATYQEFRTVFEQADGEPVQTSWARGDETLTATITSQPELDLLLYANAPADAAQHFEHGLFGLTPLVEIRQVSPGSHNEGILHDGDVVLAIGDVHGPTMRQFREAAASASPGMLSMLVLRDGEEVEVNAVVARRGTFDDTGMLNVMPGYALDVPYTAAPLERIAVQNDEGEQSRNTPVHGLQLFPATRIDVVGDTPVDNWADFRAALRTMTEDALEQQAGATVELAVIHPTPGREREIVTIELTATDIATLHRLGWQSGLPEMFFEPLQITRTADGNPITALKMGSEETWKMMQLTYLTIDRLFRRTVGVDQLRGPVGIVHVGVTIADRGILYLIFLLAVISVNLAVINFLPLPIVDGGLFLFLIYEKIKGEPPSIAFQNWATIFGLLLIGTLFLVVTYNDIARLLS